MRYFQYVKDDMKKNNQTCILPKRATEHSAGYDFYSPTECIIAPGESKMIWTDVKAYMNYDEVLMLYVRSSMGKYPVVLANGTGIIDSDYYSNEYNDGNIGFKLINNGKEPYVINVGDKIGQGVFMNFLVTIDDKPEGIRSGGFGSTGK